MGFRILADEHIDRATVKYLRTLGHDIESVGSVEALGFGSDDQSIVAYAQETDRLILTQDDDFLTCFTITQTTGILFQPDETLSAREIGDIPHEIVQFVDQSDSVLEFISRNWL